MRTEKRFLSRFMPAALRLIIFLAVLCLSLAAVSASAESRLMVVSDLHYLTPELYRNSGLFLSSLRRGDGKLTQYGEELLAALYREITAEKPDVLLVTGDLTFNGEKASHLALADWFRTVEEAGVPVRIIPGNHDINISAPVGFSGETYYRTDPVTPEEFASVYSGFTWFGDAGFSYTVKVSDSLWVAMTDVSWYRDGAQTFGLFTDRHEAWLDSVLSAASEAGAQVVTATHHSLLPHTEFSRDNFLMFGSGQMASLAARYGVKLNLSGHLHIQHIAREDGLADAALGAFCIWPHRYALVTAGDDGSLVYEARELDSRFLPEGFPEMSREWFAGITREKASASLTGKEDEIRMMADYAARFNLAYFSGTFREDDASWTEDPAYALWESHPESVFRAYMHLVMAEASGDNLRLECAPPVQGP